MATIEIPNVRQESTVLMPTTLKDNGVAVDWSGLQNIKAYMYSDAQRVIAGKCDVEVDGEDATVLKVTYAATRPQYLGVNSLLVRCKYQGREKSYDVPVLNFVERTAQATGVTVLDDPVIDVEIEVDEVSTSLLDGAIAAALDAAVAAEEAAAKAEHMVDIHQGPPGPVGVTEVEATIDDNSGTPEVEVSLENQRLLLAFKKLKGPKGDPGDTPTWEDFSAEDKAAIAQAAAGSVVDNNLDTDDLAATGNNKIQFANRAYNAQQPNGKGYKILRKDATFAEQVTDTNTIYEIRYDFDLGGNEFAMPAGCVLRFVGGSISNGTITSNPFRIVADNDVSILKGISFEGSYITNDTIFVDWFDFVTDGTTDNYTAFKRLEALVNNKAGGRIVFGKSKTYALKTIVQYATNVYIPDSACGIRFKGCPYLDIDLNGSTLKQLASNTPMANIIKIDNCVATVHDGSITGDRLTHDYTPYTNYAGVSSDDFEWNNAIHNAGGTIELYNLTVSNFCGSGIVIGSGTVAASLSYHGEYHIHDCSISYCGNNGIVCHSSTSATIARVNIHHIGDYASKPGYAPMAGIDMEFEDGVGDTPDFLIDSLIISDCKQKAITIANNTFFANFVCRDSLFKDAGLVLGNLDNANNTGSRTIENCVFDQTDTTASYTRNIGLAGADLVNCELKGVAAIVSLPRKAFGCKFISTDDSTLLPSSGSAFPSGSGVSFCPMDSCTVEVNAGFLQVYGQHDIRDTFFHFMSGADTPRFASVTFTGCRFKTEATLGRTNTNIGTGDIIYNGCDIEWAGSGQDVFNGYNPAQKNILKKCHLKSTSISSYGGVVIADGSQFDSCYIGKTSKANVAKDEYTNSHFYNCSGSGTGAIVFSNCTIVSDRETDKRNVLGLSCYIDSWDKYVFINCTIAASNFTSPTRNIYSTYYNCYLDIADATLPKAKLYNCVVRSTVANSAEVFEDSVYLQSGVRVGYEYPKFVLLANEAAYEAITTKDPNTLYLIPE